MTSTVGSALQLLHSPPPPPLLPLLPRACAGAFAAFSAAASSPSWLCLRARFLPWLADVDEDSDTWLVCRDGNATEPLLGCRDGSTWSPSSSTCLG